MAKIQPSKVKNLRSKCWIKRHNLAKKKLKIGQNFKCRLNICKTANLHKVCTFLSKNVCSHYGDEL